jgi:hypothetical protein
MIHHQALTSLEWLAKHDLHISTVSVIEVSRHSLKSLPKINGEFVHVWARGKKKFLDTYYKQAAILVVGEALVI